MSEFLMLIDMQQYSTMSCIEHALTATCVTLSQLGKHAAALNHVMCWARSDSNRLSMHFGADIKATAETFKGL